MVPLADLMNTSRHHERHVDFAFEAGHFVMRAVRDGAAGSAVTDSYGPKSNGRYLLNYGFAMEDNVDERGASLEAGRDKGASMSLQRATFSDDMCQRKCPLFENSTRDNLSSKNESKRVKTDRDTSLER